jgi:hypothetical protein
VFFNPSFESAISTARLSTYRSIARDDDHAWSLYRWNLDLVAAFGPLASDTEVALRNTIHEQLSLHFGRTDWWASPDLILDDTTTDVLSAAARDHQRKIAKGTVGAGKVIAELMLGSWVMLLSRGGTSSLGKPIDYETNLWRPALRLGFATGTATKTGRIRRPIREQAHSRAANLQRLRNRAAHHEPIFDGIRAPGGQQRVSLLEVWNGTVELLGWIAPDLAAHHASHAVVPRLIDQRPR